VPHAYTWPDSEAVDPLRGWELLHENTLGEMQLRIVFNEYEMQLASKAAAEGWDGDSYRVFKRPADGAMLLLLYTSWDSEVEAAQFAGIYGMLQEKKYPDGNEAVALEQAGRDVLVVEGGEPAHLPALLTYLKSVTKTKPPLASPGCQQKITKRTENQ
jgi:hypothetical protein